MKAIPQAQVLREALVQIREIVNDGPVSDLSVKQLRRVVKTALDLAAKPDPLMAAAVALAKSVELLKGELDAAAQAMKRGELWVCQETPKRLDEALDAIAAARAAGVVL